LRQTNAILSLILLCLGFAVHAGANAPVPPSQAAGYSLVFYDDFVNLNLSPDSTGQYAWYAGIWWEPSLTPFSASISSSALDLTWNRGQNPPDTTVSSCSSDGNRCRAFRYGYIEARMKWDVTTGAWPAFWMVPVESMWGATETGELDIFEGQGDPANSRMFFGTIHDWLNNNGTAIDVANNNGQNYYAMPGVDFTQWHTYGVLWIAGKVIWYFDDKPVLSAATYPIFDQQEGANWSAGNLNGVTANSLNLYVDWVKVWQYNEPQKTITRILLDSPTSIARQPSLTAQ